MASTLASVPACLVSRWGDAAAGWVFLVPIWVPVKRTSLGEDSFEFLHTDRVPFMSPDTVPI
jgi:hypothetical protein